MNKEKYAEFTAGLNDNGKRADRIIRQFIKDQALNGIYKAFRKGLIRINDKKAKPESKIYEGDSLFIYKSLLQGLENTIDKTTGSIESVKDQIVFESDDLLAINKKKGQLVHGEKGSLEEMVRHYLKNRIPSSLSFQPGPLHRLDRNTSGLIYFSKSINGAREFSEELQNKNFIKYYITLLDGTLKIKDIWVDNLHRDKGRKKTFIDSDGKNACSTAYPVHSYRGYTLAVIKIETGRTHQIRAQASFHKHSLSGDNKYGGSSLKGGYILHSLMLKSNNQSSQLYDNQIKASINKETMKRLNSVLSNCTIDELRNKISVQLEDL